MFVCLNSEAIIDIDEVLLLLADHYTARICWVPLHIIMMRNLLVRVSVNSVIDFTVLTFYSITSEIGPSLHIGNLLIFQSAWVWSAQDTLSSKQPLTGPSVLPVSLALSRDTSHGGYVDWNRQSEPQQDCLWPSGTQEPRVCCIHGTAGCLPGGGPGPGPPCFHQRGAFLTPSNPSGGREALNAQSLPRNQRELAGTGPTEPRNCTHESGN